MDRDVMVGVTYWISGLFGEEPPFQTVHCDRLRCYDLPVVFPLAGPSKAVFAPSPATVLQEAAPPGSPEALFLSDMATDCDLESGMGPCGLPVHALDPHRVSQVRRLLYPWQALWTM